MRGNMSPEMDLLEREHFEVKHHWNKRGISHKLITITSNSRKVYNMLLTLVTISLLFTSAVHSLEVSDDSCNWTGSGLSVDAATNAVQLLTLHCQSGHVTWMYPRNALQINFMLPQRIEKEMEGVAEESEKGHFRLCLNLRVSGNGANIYREMPERLVPILMDDRPEFEKNTLGNEQHVHEIYRRLKYERTAPMEEHCFEVTDGKAAIFIEAGFNPLSLKYITALDYRLETLPGALLQRLHHRRQECKTCAGGEIIAAFCSHDFAVKSRMLAVTEEESTKETYIDVAIGRIYRQRDTVFLPGKHSRYYGIIATPTHCKTIQKLDGPYLMTGKINLGRAELGCMAHMTEVKRVAREIDAAGVSPCDLSPLLGHHRYIE